MNESAYQQLREIAWKRRLTPLEEKEMVAYLSLLPEEQAAWDEERQLTQLLQRLPDAPVASNFTAQVMQAVHREFADAPRTVEKKTWWSVLAGRWLPRTATAFVLVAAGMSAWQQMRISRRLDTARSLTAVSPVAGSQDVEVWQDFDAILRLGQLSAQVDTDLLKALQ
ncbi:MAG: hypothetical protein HY043_10300 [Verrucomicrobia bacterium]|nr:hypothetical protein [Verrucomicrobiota bacterium]